MPINLDVIPYYLVLRTGCEPYVLNADRRVLRREASRLLHRFAKTRGAPTSIANDAWNAFSGTESIPPIRIPEVIARSMLDRAANYGSTRDRIAGTPHPLKHADVLARLA